MVKNTHLPQTQKKSTLKDLGAKIDGSRLYR